MDLKTSSFSIKERAVNKAIMKFSSISDEKLLVVKISASNK